VTTVQEAAASIANLGVSPTDILALSQPTPRDQIKTRQGPGGKQLSYVTARFVMQMLDDVVGPDNWQSKHTMEGDKVQCSIGIRVNGEWIWKSDGAGETDIEGEKGSFSDALKRAAVSWGIARDLYPDAANHQPTTPPPSARTERAAPSARSAPAPSGECPIHHKAFKPGSKGRPDYCSGKMPDGSWCQEHP
jgi:hypothetical protein